MEEVKVDNWASIFKRINDKFDKVENEFNEFIKESELDFKYINKNIETIIKDYKKSKGEK
jgi:hypothetical protein